MLGSAASSSRPPWSSESLSSRAEHSMPGRPTPRSLPILMGSCRRRRAAARRRPARTAPDADAGVGRAADDVQRARRACRRRRPGTAQAVGVRVPVDGRPATTTPVNGGARRTSSTSMPAMVSRRPARRWRRPWCRRTRATRIRELHRQGLQNGWAKLTGTGAGSAGRLEEQAQVVDAVAQHGQAVGPMPKAKPMRSGSRP